MTINIAKLPFLCNSGSDARPDNSLARNTDDVKSIDSSSTVPDEQAAIPSHDYLQIRLGFLEDLEGQRWSFTEIQTVKPRGDTESINP